MFAGQLPYIPIFLSDAKTFLGKCCFKKRKLENGKMEYFDFSLRINTRLDLPEREVEDTIIHEMIHYFIAYKNLEDATSHGPIFQHIMNSINEKYGRNLSISYKSSDEEKEVLVDKKQHYHVVAVVVFHNGRSGIKVLPRIIQRIVNYYNNISRQKEIAVVRLYMSNDVFFNRFPNSSSLRVHYVDAEVIKEHLKGAEVLECDGKTII
jgi:hypothetical protein